jgi:expansin (peptidoglycan-binding protein)
MLQRSWLAAALTAALIVVSGKRGTAIGMVVVLLAYPGGIAGAWHHAANAIARHTNKRDTA